MGFSAKNIESFPELNVDYLLLLLTAFTTLVFIKILVNTIEI